MVEQIFDSFYAASGEGCGDALADAFDLILTGVESSSIRDDAAKPTAGVPRRRISLLNVARGSQSFENSGL